MDSFCYRSLHIAENLEEVPQNFSSQFPIVSFLLNQQYINWENNFKKQIDDVMNIPQWIP
jgi:hypothetical protein